MFGKGRRAERRAEELFRIVYAADVAPLPAMEELIGLGQQHPRAQERALQHLRDLLNDGGDDRGLCRLLIVAGEWPPDGVLTVALAAGCGDDPEVLYRVVVPILCRHAPALVLLPIQLIHQAETADVRRALYRALEGALLAPDEATRERLSVFAQERWYLEMAGPDRDALGIYPLRLLLQVDEGKYIELMGRMRETSSKAAGRALDSLETALRTGAYLNDARTMAALDWRALARSL